LDSQRRRRNDEDPFGPVSSDEFLDDDAEFNGLNEADLVADEVAVFVGIENLVGGLDLVRFDLDSVAGQRKKAVVLIGKIESNRSLPKVVVKRGVRLDRCEPVDERIEFLDMGEAAGKFAELPLRGENVKGVATVWTFLDFRDLSPPTDELDVVADPKLVIFYGCPHGSLLFVRNIKHIINNIIYYFYRTLNTVIKLFSAALPVEILLEILPNIVWIG